MRLAALLLLLSALPVLAGPTDDEAACAAVAVELAKLRLHSSSAATVTPQPVPRVTDYERIYARVMAGERVTVMVGSFGLDGYPGKLAAGEWTFWLQDGKPVMERREVSQPASPFSTMGTSVPPAVAPSSSWSGSFPRVGTFIGVRGTARSGSTDCAPGVG